jgi:hypothetical protein
LWLELQEVPPMLPPHFLTQQLVARKQLSKIQMQQFEMLRPPLGLRRLLSKASCSFFSQNFYF